MWQVQFFCQVMKIFPEKHPASQKVEANSTRWEAFSEEESAEWGVDSGGSTVLQRWIQIIITWETGCVTITTLCWKRKIGVLIWLEGLNPQIFYPRLDQHILTSSAPFDLSLSLTHWGMQPHRQSQNWHFAFVQTTNWNFCLYVSVCCCGPNTWSGWGKDQVLF